MDNLNIPAGSIPKGWVPVSGIAIDTCLGLGGYKTTYILLDSVVGKKIEWEVAKEELGLSNSQDYWVDENGIEVAINFSSSYKFPRKAVSFSPSLKRGINKAEVIFGDPGFFEAKGFAVLEHRHSDNYSGETEFYSCSKEIIVGDLPLFNLRFEGWYPVKVDSQVVVWATGLNLFKKGDEWIIGKCPWNGKDYSLSENDPEEGKGARVYDSSPKRLSRLKRFFLENLGMEYDDLRGIYVRLAEESGLKKWIPDFEGWGISDFPGLECRWKQPKEGKEGFYGVIIKK